MPLARKLSNELALVLLVVLVLVLSAAFEVVVVLGSLVVALVDLSALLLYINTPSLFFVTVDVAVVVDSWLWWWWWWSVSSITRAQVVSDNTTGRVFRRGDIRVYMCICRHAGEN